MQTKKNTVSFLFILILMLVLVFAVSCGDTETSIDGDDSDGDNSENDSEGSITDGDDELNVIIDGDEEPEEEIEVEYFNPTNAEAFRLTSFKIAVPDNLEYPILGTTIDIKQVLEVNIESRIQKNEFNIILIPSKANLAEYPYEMMFVMAGEPPQTGDEEPAFAPDYNEGYNLKIIKGESKEKFTTDKGQELNFPLSEGMDFALKDAVLSGTYTDEGIDKGALAGVVSQEDANTIEIYQGATLATIFTAMAMVPDYTFDNGKQGYSFIFTYTAEPITLAE